MKSVRKLFAKIIPGAESYQSKIESIVLINEITL